MGFVLGASGVAIWVENKVVPREYRNTIAGSSPGERIIIFFDKIRFASQKTEFLNFRFLAKKNQ